MSLKPEASTLNSKEFNRVLSSWKQKVELFTTSKAWSDKKA